LQEKILLGMLIFFLVPAPLEKIVIQNFPANHDFLIRLGMAYATGPAGQN
jgi:hypothetical protein